MYQKRPDTVAQFDLDKICSIKMLQIHMSIFVRVGNLGRNTERTPSVYNTDLTLLKRTRISETVFFEARTELFNAFNQPNFPGTGLISTGANALTQGFFLNPDTSNTSGGGRVVRYQLKLVF